jgi:hypothetical protein
MSSKTKLSNVSAALTTRRRRRVELVHELCRQGIRPVARPNGPALRIG